MHSDDEFRGQAVWAGDCPTLFSDHGGRVWAEAEVNKGTTFCHMHEEKSRMKLRMLMRFWRGDGPRDAPGANPGTERRRTAANNLFRNGRWR